MEEHTTTCLPTRAGATRLTEWVHQMVFNRRHLHVYYHYYHYYCCGGEGRDATHLYRKEIRCSANFTCDSSAIVS